MKRTCAVRLTRYYRASPSDVWAALTDPASLPRWLGPVADADLSPGGRLELRLDDGGALRAEIRALDAERLLELDWAAPGEEPSLVRFELRPDGEGTVLVLDHRLIEARFGMRAMSLWERHLTQLDKLLGVAETA